MSSFPDLCSVDALLLPSLDVPKADGLVIAPGDHVLFNGRHEDNGVHGARVAEKEPELNLKRAKRTKLQNPLSALYLAPAGMSAAAAITIRTNPQSPTSHLPRSPSTTSRSSRRARPRPASVRRPRTPPTRRSGRGPGHEKRPIKRQSSTISANLKRKQEKLAPRTWVCPRNPSPIWLKWWKLSRKVPYVELKLQRRGQQGVHPDAAVAAARRDHQLPTPQ